MSRSDAQLKHLYENKELIIFCEGIDYWNRQIDQHFPNSDTMRVGEKTWLTQRLMYELSKGYYPIEDDDQYIQFKNYGVGIPGKKSRNKIK